MKNAGRKKVSTALNLLYVYIQTQGRTKQKHPTHSTIHLLTYLLWLVHQNMYSQLTLDIRVFFFLIKNFKRRKSGPASNRYRWNEKCSYGSMAEWIDKCDKCNRNGEWYQKVSTFFWRCCVECCVQYKYIQGHMEPSSTITCDWICANKRRQFFIFTFFDIIILLFLLFHANAARWGKILPLHKSW